MGAFPGLGRGQAAIDYRYVYNGGSSDINLGQTCILLDTVSAGNTEYAQEVKLSDTLDSPSVAGVALGAIPVGSYGEVIVAGRAYIKVDHGASASVQVAAGEYLISSTTGKAHQSTSTSKDVYGGHYFAIAKTAATQETTSGGYYVTAHIDCRINWLGRIATNPDRETRLVYNSGASTINVGNTALLQTSAPVAGNTRFLPEVKLSDAASSAVVAGVALESIAAGAIGRICTYGLCVVRVDHGASAGVQVAANESIISGGTGNAGQGTGDADRFGVAMTSAVQGTDAIYRVYAQIDARRLWQPALGRA